MRKEGGIIWLGLSDCLPKPKSIIPSQMCCMKSNQIIGFKVYPGHTVVFSQYGDEVTKYGVTVQACKEPEEIN